MAEEFLKALQELRKQDKKGKFNQSIDLIVNLKKIDLKKNVLNFLINFPHKFKDVKVCAFLNEKSNIVDSITKTQFAKFKEKKDLRKLVKKYDFFIASANLMPAVATTFGRALGPAGKMPSPQLGILVKEDEKSITELLGKVSRTLKIRPKEPTIKTAIGKEKMSDKELEENFKVVYNQIVSILPNKKENIRSILIKFTMSKPVKIKI